MAGVGGSVVAGGHGVPNGETASPAESTNEQSPVIRNHGVVENHYADSDIHLEYVFSQHPDRGVVSMKIIATLPPGVDRFTLTIPERVSVDTASGFSRVNDFTWEWQDDGSVAQASLTTRFQVNQTSGTFGGLDYAATNEWALLNTPYLSPWWLSATDTKVSETTRLAPDQPGYAGSSMAFLGNVSVDRETRAGQEFVVVTPDVVDEYPADPGQIVDTLAFSSERLDVNARDDGVNVFLAPAAIRSGGIAVSDDYPDTHRSDDVWVTGTHPGTGTTYIHEYAHTRQVYKLSTEMDWFTEASASYYDQLLALHLGTIDYERFRYSMSAERDNDTTLTDENRPPLADYKKGMRVLAALDVKIRRATSNESTLQDVWRQMNAENEEISYTKFQDIVADVAGTRFDEWLDTHLTTGAAPTVPDEQKWFIPTEPGADSDGDGLDDSQELTVGSSPFSADTDNDGLTDTRELELGTNPTERDTDGDGLSDTRELTIGSDPTAVDTDDDGLEDQQETRGETNLTNPDTDGDGIEDGHEMELGTDPTKVDTDDDGLNDSRELELGTDPLVADSDNDGLDDGQELSLGTNATNADTDGDGIEDGREVELGTDPTAGDTDGDGLTDLRERELGTDPTTADSDGDGVDDTAEVEQGTDPMDPTDPTATPTQTPGQTVGEDAINDAVETPGFTPVTAVVAVVVGLLFVRWR